MNFLSNINNHIHVWTLWQIFINSFSFNIFNFTLKYIQIYLKKNCNSNNDKVVLWRIDTSTCTNIDCCNFGPVFHVSRFFPCFVNIFFWPIVPVMLCKYVFFSYNLMCYVACKKICEIYSCVDVPLPSSFMAGRFILYMYYIYVNKCNISFSVFAHLLFDRSQHFLLHQGGFNAIDFYLPRLFQSYSLVQRDIMFWLKIIFSDPGVKWCSLSVSYTFVRVTFAFGDSRDERLSHSAFKVL